MDFKSLLFVKELESEAGRMQPLDFVGPLVAQGIAIPVSIISFIPVGLSIAAARYQHIMSLFGYPYELILCAALISKVLFLTLIFSLGFSASVLLAKKKVEIS